MQRRSTCGGAKDLYILRRRLIPQGKTTCTTGPARSRSWGLWPVCCSVPHAHRTGQPCDAEGLALWNALALTNGNLDKVAYLSDPTDFPEVSRGGVTVVRVKGLDASDQKAFIGAMRGLGTLGHNLHSRVDRKDKHFRFHLSSGYKATMPFLIGLAEGLRSLPGSGPVDAYAVHETTRTDAIRLPLRGIHPRVIRGLMESFNGSTCDTPLGNPEMRGYIYDREDGSATSRLTPFGEGLFALFGRPAEGI
jgi:hypothetical protein